MTLTEAELETVTLDLFRELGYSVEYGPGIAHDSERPERKSYREVVLVERLQQALVRINPGLSAEVLAEAAKKVSTLTGSHLVEANKTFHRMLTDGVDVESRREDGSSYTEKVWLLDTKNLQNNDWLVVNQFTIQEDRTTRRLDVIVFVNGLPLALIELKNPADINATVEKAWNQLQTYKSELSTLFQYNELLVISDGLVAKVGTLTADLDRFMLWRSVDGKELAPTSAPQLEVLIRGVFGKERLLDLIQHFTTYETDGDKIAKMTAAYHQYFATQKAVEKTIEAAKGGDRRGGVVWHTQGSGKSLTMLFYAGKLVQALDNPTIVVLTDRNDLDDQLFGTFARSKDLLRQAPMQAKNRGHLKELLQVAAGGIVFTTIQKFFPENSSTIHDLLSKRENIVVIVDEAHRSQYGFKARVNHETGKTGYGFAKYVRDALPNATFIGFTGTPVSFMDKDTKKVFGDYVDVYDVSQSVEDKATVPIYYEARLAKIELKESEKPHLDEDFEEATEGEELEHKEKLKSKWARVEAMVGAEKRLQLIAKDIVDHFENRLSTIEGKGMIVAMSRRIAVELYNEIIKLRPNWHSDDEDKGFIKVVMTGSAADPQHFQPHVRNKMAREALAKRMKDVNDPLKLVIVRDMWLTGFDVPSMHTMYIDKPMKGHTLMQAIARVNRVYKDKQAGLVVDYLGIATELKKALAHYSKHDQKEVGVPQEEAISVMLGKYEIVQDLLHGFDYQQYFTAKSLDRIRIIAAAMEHVLGLEDGKKSFLKAVTELSYAFSIVMPQDEALKLRDEVAFFQAVRASIAKLEQETSDGSTNKSKPDCEEAIKQIISGAISSNEVVDVFSAAGLKKPDISILSDEFLEDVKNMEHKNIAVELLRKLLNDEIRVISRKNVIKSRSFSEMLEETILKYQNRTIESAAVIAELIELAKKMKQEHERGDDMGMTDDEIAFYDALAVNESAVQELGDETLKTIAQELVRLIREHATIDWTMKENVQAKLRVLVKRLLKKYKYPPDKQENAVQTILEQAEIASGEALN